jgi:AcrR family transcriptional regulator
MARPAKANPQETMRRLVEVALPMFAQRGFHGTVTREIALAARCNGAVINHYFGGKQGLYDSTVDYVYERLRRRGREALAGIVPTDTHVVMSALYSAARAERDGVRILVRQVLDQGRLTAHTEAKHFLPEIDRTARMLADLTGVSTARARDATVTLGYLLSRFVIQDDRSLMAAFGVRSAKEAHARVIATLTTTARALLVSKE